MQVVESSPSSDELQCAGCSSCRGPLASDVEDADDEYDDAGDGIAAGSSKNSWQQGELKRGGNMRVAGAGTEEGLKWDLQMG